MKLYNYILLPMLEIKIKVNQIIIIITTLTDTNQNTMVLIVVTLPDIINYDVVIIIFCGYEHSLTSLPYTQQQHAATIRTNILPVRRRVHVLFFSRSSKRRRGRKTTTTNKNQTQLDLLP